MVSKLIDLNRCKWPLLAGAMLLVLSTHISVCPADEPARHKPDVKTWKTAREKGQKALEKKDTASAETFFKAALAEAENFDPKDYRLAESLADLGTLEANMGYLTDAETLLRRATVIREGDPHYELEADCNLILGQVSQRLGHFAEAEKAYLHAEEVLSRKLRPDNPAVLQCAFLRALLYSQQKDFARAEPLLKRCIEMFKNPAAITTVRTTEPALYGREVFLSRYKPSYALALEGMGQLGSIYFQQGKLVDAEATYKDMLQYADKNTGKTSNELAETLRDVGNFYVQTSNYSAAEPVLKRLASLREKQLGESNKITLNAEMVLAAVLRKENRNDEAEKIEKRIQAIQKAGGTDPVLPH